MAYMTMKTLRQAILENIKWSITIYVYKYMRLTCVCVISCIFNKHFYHLLPDNGSFLKGNKFLSFS